MMKLLLESNLTAWQTHRAPITLYISFNPFTVANAILHFWKIFTQYGKCNITFLVVCQHTVMAVILRLALFFL